MTVYVERGETGAIKGVYANPQEYATEAADDAGPEVAAFRSAISAPASLERTRANALMMLLTRADEIGIQVRLILDAVCTLSNDTFEEMGRGRPLTADKLLAHVASNPTAGDPAGG